MSEPSEFEDLVIYLVRTTRLSRAEATRLVAEVLAFLDERPEEFVSRRHRALQGEGLSNSAIFARLSSSRRIVSGENAIATSPSRQASAG